MKTRLMILVLAAACQSEKSVTPTMAASGADFSNGLSSIPVGNVCSTMTKGETCLTDGTVISVSPAGFFVTGPRGTYTLKIEATSVRVDVVGGTLLNPSRAVLTATGARFTVNSMNQSEVINYIYSSGSPRDLVFTVSATTLRTNYLSIKRPGGRVPFTVGRGGTQFGGDEWDLRSRFGGDEWDIKISDGEMSITSADDWESPITADDDWDAIQGKPKSQVAFQFNSGNLTALPGLVNVLSTEPFNASIRLGSLTMSAFSSCGAKLCDPKDANINFLLTEVGFPAVLTIPSTSFRSFRER